MEQLSDTKKLLKECSAGIKMAVSAIDDVIDYAKDTRLKSILDNSRKEHVMLEHKIQATMTAYHSDDKDPNVMAKGMSKMKTGMKLAMNNGDDDKTIADLITDGCNMGIKSLHRYMNQYPAADGSIKSYANELIAIEQDLLRDMVSYL